jgi:hypothetical protein
MKYVGDMEFDNNGIQYLVERWWQCSSIDKGFVKNSLMLVTYVSIFPVKITVISNHCNHNYVEKHYFSTDLIYIYFIKYT